MSKLKTSNEEMEQVTFNSIDGGSEMSIITKMYCEKHNMEWDSDFDNDCPECIDEDIMEEIE